MKPWTCFHSFTQKRENVGEFHPWNLKVSKTKWKCSPLWWFQNDAWICMKNLSSIVILKLVENNFWYVIVSLKLRNSFLKIDYDLSTFSKYLNIIEKSWLKNTSQILDEDDYKFENQIKKYFHFFFETDTVTLNYFTFFPQFHFFSWLFLRRNTDF